MGGRDTTIRVDLNRRGSSRHRRLAETEARNCDLPTTTADPKKRAPSLHQGLCTPHAPRHHSMSGTLFSPRLACTGSHSRRQLLHCRFCRACGCLRSARKLSKVLYSAALQGPIRLLAEDYPANPHLHRDVHLPPADCYSGAQA